MTSDKSHTTTREIGDDDPITLQEACDLIYRGNITQLSLLAKAKKKQLRIFKLGRTNFTTKRFIREMQEQCLDDQKVPGPTSTRVASSGQSETDRTSSALAALSQTTRELKQCSRNTSRPSTSPPPAPPR
jgi:hypothetical protein